VVGNLPAMREARRTSTGYLNFRDLGGHLAAAGVVRSGQVFRSDSLSRCDPSQVARLVGEHGLRTVIDLRHDHEIASSPLTALTDAGVAVEHIPLVDPARANWQPLVASATLAARYEYMLETAGDQFVVALGVIAADANRPLVFQCMAGKDRTGLLAAVLLGLLGVDDDSIVADYQRTADALPEMMARLEARRGSEHLETIKPYLTAEAATMRHALATLQASHGSIEQYVLDHGLTPGQIADLRAGLVEPAMPGRG
jgi:protein-tyrosine phosphatase